MRTESKYGKPPKIVAFVPLDTKEMCCWMYLPIKVPGSCIQIPENAQQFWPIVERAYYDYVGPDLSKIDDKYVYLTAKTLFTTPGNPGNRPGWHSDGFMTDDINYIWSNRNPTIFFEAEDQNNLFSFAADHAFSLDQMDRLCESRPDLWRTYLDQTLIKLDESVLHKVDTDIEPGMRTFVKVSISKERYALEGNSINHKLKHLFGTDYQVRQKIRNDPAGHK
uniref:Uncharacterized protein n=1 Tax=Ochrobactrum phage ORM_20 TaxID=2985243 RepID=A0A9N6WSS7_9VIRU|nr:hypothetical protein ORM20_00243 [Ochrobactrum phage ORM_20]